MNPLPAQSETKDAPHEPEIPSIPSVLSTPAASYSKTNRRASNCLAQRAYPWLFFTSTSLAGLFCMLYVTKPVIFASQQSSSMLPSGSLIGPKPNIPSATSPSPAVKIAGKSVDSIASDNSLKDKAVLAVFEQTNLRIQHILTAEAPGGHLAKIDLEVPVLYQSRSLRWTATEVAEARELLSRLSDYQERVQALRSESTGLLDSWNHLIERSIPSSELRADSPTLPQNQQNVTTPRSVTGQNPTELIQIQPAKK
jgi:hypothetical protein